MNKTDEARLIVTTPHPSVDWVHATWELLLVCSANMPMKSTRNCWIGTKSWRGQAVHAGLKLVLYRRFLFGANQLAVFQKTGDLA